MALVMGSGFLCSSCCCLCSAFSGAECSRRRARLPVVSLLCAIGIVPIATSDWLCSPQRLVILGLKHYDHNLPSLLHLLPGKEKMRHCMEAGRRKSPASRLAHESSSKSKHGVEDCLEANPRFTVDPPDLLLSNERNQRSPHW